MPSESTVGRAVAINRQFHDAPGPWQSDKKEVDPEAIPKYLPYRPQYRHQMWFVDLRYLVKLDDRWMYVCVIAKVTPVQSRPIRRFYYLHTIPQPNHPPKRN